MGNTILSARAVRCAGTGLAAVFIAFPGAVQASDRQHENVPRGEAPQADDDLGAQRRWVVQVTPYVWAAGIEGDVSPFRRGPTIGIEKSFSEIFDDLDFGGFVNLWARYGSVIAASDLMYVRTSDAETIGGVPVVGAVGAEVDTRQLNASLQAGYRVYSTPRFTVDLLAGVRYWSVANRLTATALGMSLSIREAFDWADPIVGGRAFYRLSDRFSVQVQADVGGFDAGAELTWQVLATLNYVLSDHFSFSAGYKILDVDYDHGGYVFDVTLRGPVLGATYRF